MPITRLYLKVEIPNNLNTPFLKKFKLVYFFMAVLGLPCCVCVGFL